MHTSPGKQETSAGAADATANAQHTFVLQHTQHTLRYSKPLRRDEIKAHTKPNTKRTGPLTHTQIAATASPPNRRDAGGIQKLRLALP